MPRRANDLELSLLQKRKKTLDDPASMDVSFCDDEALPSGIIFTDVLQKKWRIGNPIGRGSFGRIYLASDDIEKDVTKLNARYVVKIEPHTNGPLFVEVHCLIRTAQVSKVKTWRLQKNQKRLGMPVYIASGSFTDENTNVKYRFLVLPRYDIDLQKVIAKTKVLELKNVLIIALQILDVLEYLHSQGYTHSDIKSSNLMLGFDGNKFYKMPTMKPVPSFQKDTKQAVILSGRHRKAKTGKSRSSNYYDDEDFIVRDYKETEDESNDKRLASVKQKLSKILSEKDNRKLHRHHAFNLRQLSKYVNYEDLNSSVCSDKSYQKLLDDYGNKSFKHSPDDTNVTDLDMDEIQREVVYSQSRGQIYLLDYGLASKFLDSQGDHKEFGMDARKAHDGTLEYSSRDSHIGAHSRRSDLENLGYNLLDWLTGTLPWKTPEVLAEPDLVHALKKNFMGDIKLLLRTCFKTEFYPQFMVKYLQYITSLDFNERPDYEYCKSLFKNELLRNGWGQDKDLSVNFGETLVLPMGRNKLCYSKRFGRKNTSPEFLARSGIKKAYERENIYSYENDLKLELLKQTLNSSSDGIRKPCTTRNFFVSDADLVARLKKSLISHDLFGKKLSPKNLRSNKINIKKRRGVKRHQNSMGKFGNFMGFARQFTWAEILAGNPEDIIRKERNTNTVNTDAEEDEDDENTCKYRIRKLSNVSSETNIDSNLHSPLMQRDYLQKLNPTYAMKEVLANFKKKVAGKATKEQEEPIPGLEGYTPIMIRLHKLKEKRENKERNELAKQQLVNKKEKSDLVVNAVTTRCTRSMTNKNAKTEPVSTRSKSRRGGFIDCKEKITEVDTGIVTRSNSKAKTNSTTAKKPTKNSVHSKEKSVEEKSQVVTKNVCKKTVATKKVTRSSRSTNKINVTENPINIIESTVKISKNPIKITKSPIKKTRSVSRRRRPVDIPVNNRRRLRSSNRFSNGRLG